MTKTRETVLESLKVVAQAVVKNFGRHCEAVVHDLADLEHSVVFIAGDVTGRKPGAPATDLLVKTLHREGNGARDLIGYKTVTRDGRVLKSSTVFIRDQNGEIFAAFCINYDMTEFLHMGLVIQEFTELHGKRGDAGKETFATTVHETIESLVNQAIELLGKQPANMVTEEKVRLVGILEEKGAFRIKGAVDYVAAVLGVSKYTVYNYLNKVRSTSELNVL
ncbi:MAG: PAS domain-containing protein [Bacillota bacterium]|nr:PAS domain-containing protein [Bacillota bacterium]